MGWAIPGGFCWRIMSNKVGREKVRLGFEDSGSLCGFYVTGNIGRC